MSSKLECGPMPNVMAAQPNIGPKNVSIYSVSAQETAKDRAKFGWPPVSDVAAVMKPRLETG